MAFFCNGNNTGLYVSGYLLYYVRKDPTKKKGNLWKRNKLRNNTAAFNDHQAHLYNTASKPTKAKAQGRVDHQDEAPRNTEAP